MQGWLRIWLLAFFSQLASWNLDPAAVEWAGGQRAEEPLTVVGVILGASLPLYSQKLKLWVWVICTAKHPVCLRDIALVTEPLVWVKDGNSALPSGIDVTRPESSHSHGSEWCCWFPHCRHCCPYSHYDQSPLFIRGQALSQGFHTPPPVVPTQALWYKRCQLSSLHMRKLRFRNLMYSFPSCMDWSGK